MHITVPALIIDNERNCTVQLSLPGCARLGVLWSSRLVPLFE